MPKIVDKKEMRRNIVLAFEKCLESKKIASVSMRDIAKKANITHPTVMHYFPNKSELIKYYVKMVAEDYFTLLIDRYDTAKNSIIDINDLLKVLVDSMYNIDGTLHCDKKFLQIYDIAQYDSEIKEAVDDFYNQWYEFIKNILLEKSYPDAKMMAKSIQTVTEGIFLMSINTEMSHETAIKVCSKFNFAGEKS